MMNEKKEEPKIIVDDDWKTQVEAEKEQLQKEVDGQPDGDLPEASFMMIMTTFGSQAMAAMGQLPDPVTGTATVNKPLAKHFIDSLGVLEEKTQGNLTEDESGMLTNVLHQLRMMFVATPDEIPAAAQEKKSESTIELP